MHTELMDELTGFRKKEWTDLLERTGLDADAHTEKTALIWDEQRLVAAGSRQRNILKCIAVDPSHQGEDLTATLLTHLRQDAFSQGYRHLFLYPKPENSIRFSSLFFYPVVQTENVLLMENVKDGVRQFLAGLETPCKKGRIGSIVMHCNPFTRGHRYLIESAAKQCTHLYVFILSEEQSIFPAAHRLELVKAGTADLKNVTVLPTGHYLISAATFPSYFIKDKSRAGEIFCQLDIAVFLRYFVPHFGINCRFVGTEPSCRVTARYHNALAASLPKAGVDLTVIPRLEENGTPISASTVRKLLEKRSMDEITGLVPECTLAYLKKRNLI